MTIQIIHGDCMDVLMTPAREATQMIELLDGLRAKGWDVTVHRDFKIDGKKMTSWLFTHSSGVFVQGEAPTDAEALAICVEQARDWENVP